VARSRSGSPPSRGDGESGSGAVPGPASAAAALQLHLLTETPRLFAAPLSLARVFEKFVALVAGSLDTGSVLLLLREEGDTVFYLRAGRGVPRAASRSAGVACDDPLVAPLCAAGRPLVAAGLARDPRWRRSRLRQLLPARTGSLLALPLAVRDCVRGLLVLTLPAGARHCTGADMEWFLPIAEQVSLALEKMTLTRKLEQAGRALEGTVRTRTRELHEANRALRASLAEVRELRRYSEQVIASLASSLVTFDGEGQVITANPPARTVLHLGAAPVEGRSLADLFGEEFAVALLRRLGRRNVNITRAQATIAVGTGEQKAIGYSVTPLRRSRAGRSWILLFRDITDSQRLGNEMRRLDRLVSLGEISANVAHELKNPLTVMYANMEWLLEKLPAEFRPRVQITIDHMERMEAIIGRMGILSKDQPLEIRPIDLGDLVSQMIAFVDKSLHEKRIDLVVDVPAEPQWVQGDPAQLQQALLNVIMNASQAIGTHGRLTVRLDRRARGGCRGLEVGVADSGPGIPAHLLGKIFEPFFTTKETGTGLGLSITSQIVAAHRGRISAENLPDGGACVKLWLPEGKPAGAAEGRA
jgi:PAS domain S-box-containing protein